MSGQSNAPISENDCLVLIGGLHRLRREHLDVEDCWYSCPKAEDGCCDDAQGDECNCGADTHNALVDELTWILQAVRNGSTRRDDDVS